MPFRDGLDAPADSKTAAKPIEPAVELSHGIVRGPAGHACVLRTTIPVWQLEKYRQLGWDGAKIFASFPMLCASDLANVRIYVGAHREEIEKATRENEEDPTPDTEARALSEESAQRDMDAMSMAAPPVATEADAQEPKDMETLGSYRARTHFLFKRGPEEEKSIRWSALEKCWIWAPSVGASCLFVNAFCVTHLGLRKGNEEECIAKDLSQGAIARIFARQSEDFCAEIQAWRTERGLLPIRPANAQKNSLEEGTLDTEFVSHQDHVRIGTASREAESVAGFTRDDPKSVAAGDFKVDLEKGDKRVAASGASAGSGSWPTEWISALVHRIEALEAGLKALLESRSVAGQTEAANATIKTGGEPTPAVFTEKPFALPRSASYVCFPLKSGLRVLLRVASGSDLVGFGVDRGPRTPLIAVSDFEPMEARAISVALSSFSGFRSVYFPLKSGLRVALRLAPQGSGIVDFGVDRGPGTSRVAAFKLELTEAQAISTALLSLSAATTGKGGA